MFSVINSDIITPSIFRSNIWAAYMSRPNFPKRPCPLSIHSAPMVPPIPFGAFTALFGGFIISRNHEMKLEPTSN